MLRNTFTSATESVRQTFRELAPFIAFSALAAAAYLNHQAIQQTGLDPHAGYGGTAATPPPVVQPLNPK
jgi:hypothetical protein